jgi:Tol biopolymer transport system component
MTLTPGTRVGPYAITDRIGAGGMGVVYRAHDSRLRRDVALKLLSLDRHGNHDAILREARTIAALNHPHICTVHEVGVADGVSFIAMEFIEGESLSTIIRSNRWSADRVWRVGRQLAEALEHAHAHGVIHRDFKTANVMVTTDGRVKVVDFGIAVRALAVAGETVTAGVLEAGAPITGTVPYMAPEVLQGAPPDARSDIWALGVVLFEMTCGRPPFLAKTTPEVIAAIMRDAAPPLPAGTAAGLVRIIDRCLSKDPVDRPARAGEVALALEVAEPMARAADGDRARHGRWKRPRQVIAAGAAIAAIGVAFWLWRQQSTRPAHLLFANPVQVTTAVGVEEFPSWSPDGRLLAYVARAGVGFDTGLTGNSDIWVAQPGSGMPINRTGDYSGPDLFPTWSPDGSQIAFWSTRDGAGCYVMAALSGAPRRIAAANPIDPNPPQWSEDGREILCVNGEGAGFSQDARRTTLDVVTLQTGQVKRRLNLPGDLPRFVTPSRDRRLIAFITGPGGLSADLTRLNVLDVGSSNVTALTDGQTLVSSPIWSADGRTLFYVAHSGATMDLWEQRVTIDGAANGPPSAVTAGVGMRNAALSGDGRRLAYSKGRKVGNVWRVPFRAAGAATWADAQQITFEESYIECVALDRTGTKLAFNSDRAGSLDLWTVPASGGQMTQITSDPSAEWCPDWSPDGSALAFYAHRTGNREIWTVPATGGSWRQVTDHPGPDLHPSWSHDGQSIAHLTGSRPDRGGGWMSRLDGAPGRFISPSLTLPRWSPIDTRIVYASEGRIWIAEANAATPARSLADGAGGVRWTPDGSAILYRGRKDAIHVVDAAGKRAGRLLVDLSGRPGEMVPYGTPTDGRFVYFVWSEDLGDIWVMDVAASTR